ncbi:TonB-dependent receptor [Brevundimonas sp. TWP2-3-2]|uniref:TonB-dependent receptor n=1 Tax=unclassified Brevundimonas TaxID=2622653 RepID=UPI003CEFA4A7
MRIQSIRQRMLATTMMGGAAILALAALPVVALVAAPTAAVAQDYTNGTLTGTVGGANGEPISGATVTVVSNAQGISRSATTGANGQFRVPLIPTGSYTVTVAASGFDNVSDDVSVGLGNNSYVFTLGAAGASGSDVDDIVVTGVRRSLDMSRAATGVSIDVDQLIENVPVARNITAITLLAPGAVVGDSQFAIGQSQLQAPPALGGSGPAENAFFVNGLNITNFVTGLGGATVPFEFYKNVEVKTGGYSAEFGRATGGIINATTKSGTNDFVVELHGTWAPDSLREDAPNTPSGPQYAGAVNALAEFEEKTLTLEVGGPIIRDRLFAYGIVAYNDTESQSASSAGTTGTLNRDVFSDDPFYGVKLDGYITADHRLEFTYFDTTSSRTRTAFNYTPGTGAIGTTALNSTLLNQGGENWVGRYTGTFTDWLTVSAAYGETTIDSSSLVQPTAESLVQDARRDAAGLSLSNARRSRQTSAASSPQLAERKFYRADADVYFDLFGQHHVRFGYDHEDTTLTTFSIRNGGGNYVYNTASAATATSLGITVGQEYATRRIFTSGGGFDGVNEAYYIHDSWDVSDRLNLQIGFRNDNFQTANTAGVTFIDFENNYAARLGATYDPIGDGTSKFYGSYGRYFLPPVSNTAFRIAAPAIDITEFYLPTGSARFFGGSAGSTTGFDATTGLPTGGFGPQITNRPSFQACPAGTGTTAPAGAISCSVRNNGSQPDPRTLVATNLEATYEDEFIVGYESQVSDLWTLGVKAIYRNLGTIAEDALLDSGVVNYCRRNNIALTNAQHTGCFDLYNGQSLYRIINPGSAATIVVDLPNAAGVLSEQTINLTEADLPFPKVRREYTALEFTFDRAFDGVWGLTGSYTLSKSDGNTEGGVKSDVGQVDAGITQDFDFLSFLPGSAGLLPNHRAHQFKLYGSWQVFDNFTVGANLSVTSPRHYGCIGLAPPDYANGDGAVANDSYGAAARFCKASATSPSLVVDRGSALESDWTTRFDLALRYSLDDIVPGNLVLRADIINVFNLQGVTQINEFGEDDSGNLDATYGAPTVYQAPRSVRFGFDWAF